MVQHYLVEHSARRLSTLVSVNQLCTQFFKRHSISDGFRCSLSGELVMDIPWQKVIVNFLKSFQIRKINLQLDIQIEAWWFTMPLL